MSGRAFSIVRRDEVWNGFFKAEDLEIRHDRFDGGSALVKRERWIQKRAVSVLPYDPVHDLVLLVEQFRTGAMEQPEGPWVIEAVAGMIDQAQSPADTARREAVEEAGVQLTELEEVGVFLSSPGCTTERVHVFIGLTDLSAAGGVHGLAEEQEDILVHVLPFAEAMRRLAQGLILGVTALVGLQALALRRDAYRSAAASA